MAAKVIVLEMFGLIWTMLLVALNNNVVLMRGRDAGTGNADSGS